MQTSAVCLYPCKIAHKIGLRKPAFVNTSINSFLSSSQGSGVYCPWSRGALWAVWWDRTKTEGTVHAGVCARPRWVPKTHYNTLIHTPALTAVQTDNSLASKEALITVLVNCWGNKACKRIRPCGILFYCSAAMCVCRWRKHHKCQCGLEYKLNSF